MGDKLNLKLDDDTLRRLTRELDRHAETGALQLKPESEFVLRSEGDKKKIDLIQKLEKWVDADSGAIKVLEVHVQGKPLSFQVQPDFGDGLSITLRVQFRF
jgi:hypothetical protein